MFELKEVGNDMGGVCGECGKNIEATEHFCEECYRNLMEAMEEEWIESD